MSFLSLLAFRLHVQTTPSLSIRNHGGVPDIDEDAFYLEIGGLVNKPVRLTLKDLKDPVKFP